MLRNPAYPQASQQAMTAMNQLGIPIPIDDLLALFNSATQLNQKALLPQLVHNPDDKVTALLVAMMQAPTLP